MGSNDNYLYAITSTGNWIVLHAATLYPNAAKLLTGTRKWRFKAAGIVLASAAFGSDGSIYTGDNYGKVYALSSSGNEYCYEF